MASPSWLWTQVFLGMLMIAAMKAANIPSSSLKMAKEKDSVMKRGAVKAASIPLSPLSMAKRGQWNAGKSGLPPPCDSEIYCYGDLLHTVQMAHLHPDSKYFVDMSMKNSPNETLAAFDDMMIQNNNNPSQERVEAFVAEQFDDPGTEFELWDPTDWTQSPKFLEAIKDPELEVWARALNDLWKVLGRKISDVVKQEPERFSQIYVDHPVVVPGGRFREFYYWDSYWTIKGLLLSGMTETVKGMLENFLQMVTDYGMVPNGGRIYYTRRSQPPYLIPMVKLYLDHTQDWEFLRNNIHILEKEFLFWENNRSRNIPDISGQLHTVYHYYSSVGGPRPESYREDFELASSLATDLQKEELYVELKSGAESGWDYSTRWFLKDDSNQGTMIDLRTSQFAAVDLNSLMCFNAHTLSSFYKQLGDASQARIYQDIGTRVNRTLAELFWDSTEGSWFDVNIVTQEKRRYFYLSNVHPLWSGCYGLEGPQDQTVSKVIKYLKKTQAINYIGGLPTSLINSGQQWDFPNAWAPLQHTTIIGLHQARAFSSEAGELAFSLSQKWVRNNWLTYQQSIPHAMFEKYNVSIRGLPGGGGEYDVQVGFGWTNGVALHLMTLFGDRMTATDGSSTASPSTNGFPSEGSVYYSSSGVGSNYSMILLTTLLALGMTSFSWSPHHA